VKRFQIETSTLDKKFVFISEQKGAKLVLATTVPQPQVEVTYMIKGVKERKTMSVDLDMLIDIKGWKAMGNKLTPHAVKKVTLLNGSSDKKAEADAMEDIQEATIAAEETSSEEAIQAVEIEEVEPERSIPVAPPEPVAQPKPVAPPKTEPPTNGKDKEGGYNIGDTIELF